MLNVRHRFHGYGSLKPVYARGQTLRGPLMNLKVLKRRSGEGYRAAVVVSRKVHKSAVRRNRIRRRIYEIIRQADSELTNGRDIVLTVFSDKTAELPAPELKKMIEKLLKKAADEH